MPLTLTSLIPTFYSAMDVVSRERIGFIQAVSRDSSAERAALDQTVMSPVVGVMASEALTVTNVAATAPNQTINNVSITISKAQSVPFGITGEETLGLGNAGTLATVNRDRIAQALRTLSNEIEADLAGLHTKASRAYGHVTTTAFGTGADLSDFAQTLKILEDNGAPSSDMHMVLGGTATANIRGKQSGLFKVNEAGSDDLLRTGNMGSIMGYDLHNSKQVKAAVTVGTGTGYQTNEVAGYAVGATSITLDTGSNTVIAGDIVSFAGDTNLYIVKTALTANVVVLQEPGLVKTLANDVAMTITAATTRNMFFHRSAIQLATRAPAMPEGGDNADDMLLITDPVSGIVYEFLVYRQKRQLRYEVNLAWGFAMTAPRHCGVLIGG